MAKKKARVKPMATATGEEKAIRHARIEMSDSVHSRVLEQSKRFGLSLSAYLRVALIEKLERDEATR